MHELTPRLEALFYICTAAVIVVIAISFDCPMPGFRLLGLIAFAFLILFLLYMMAIGFMESTPIKNRKLPWKGQIGFCLMVAGSPIIYPIGNLVLGLLVILAGLLLVLNSIQLRERRSHAMETSEEEKAPD